MSTDLNADALAEVLAGAASNYHAARSKERRAQDHLDQLTQDRRAALVALAEATAARERAGETLIQLATEKRSPGNRRDRMLAEHAELAARLDRLTNFLASPAYAALPEDERDAADAQAKAMAAYSQALTRRIDQACSCDEHSACPRCAA